MLSPNKRNKLAHISAHAQRAEICSRIRYFRSRVPVRTPSQLRQARAKLGDGSPPKYDWREPKSPQSVSALCPLCRRYRFHGMSQRKSGVKVDASALVNWGSLDPGFTMKVSFRRAGQETACVKLCLRWLPETCRHLGFVRSLIASVETPIWFRPAALSPAVHGSMDLALCLHPGAEVSASI